MKNLSEFHPRIQQHVTGCPEPTLNAALVDTAIVFCERSRAITRKTGGFTTLPGIAAYSVEAPLMQRVSTVTGVWIGGNKLTPMVDAHLAPGASGTPTRHYGSRDDERHELFLYPTPDTGVVVVVEAAFCPLRAATQLEDDLLEIWVDAIVAGTVARLKALPNQIFTDLPQAAVMGKAFYMLTSQARVTASNVFTQGSYSVAPRPFA